MDRDCLEVFSQKALQQQRSACFRMLRKTFHHKICTEDFERKEVNQRRTASFCLTAEPKL